MVTGLLPGVRQTILGNAISIAYIPEIDNKTFTRAFSPPLLAPTSGFASSLLQRKNRKEFFKYS